MRPIHSRSAMLRTIVRAGIAFGLFWGIGSVLWPSPLVRLSRNVLALLGVIVIGLGSPDRLPPPE